MQSFRNVSFTDLTREVVVREKLLLMCSPFLQAFYLVSSIFHICIYHINYRINITAVLVIAYVVIMLPSTCNLVNNNDIIRETMMTTIIDLLSIIFGYFSND